MQSLEGEWALVVSDPDDYAHPSDIPDKTRRIAAPVPGTVAQALELAGRFDRTNPIALANRDFWYLARLDGTAPGRARLIFEGLATIAEVFVNGRKVLESRNQFARHDLPVILKGSDEIAICFRALNPHLEMRGPRARWRPQMVTPQGLRLIRTTLLGHMPGWCPNVDAIGPFRPVYLTRAPEDEIADLRIEAGLDERGSGLLDVSFRHAGRAGDMQLLCNGHASPVLISAEGRLHAQLRIPDISPWWPHTHGEPTLYDVSLQIDDTIRHLARTGFRNIDLDRGADGKGFGIRINGLPIFCRGAVWTNADIVRLPGGREDYRHWLEKARNAGMNMLRVGGTMTYESTEFFALCDEMGIMVWQDFMLANFDYPVSDPAFVDAVSREAGDLLSGLQGSPSLTVLCGGSEMFQQAAMLGLPKQHWGGPLTDEILPAVARSLRPDVVYVPNSPFGGAMPFSPNEGVTHYYGVGAYCRPLEDARRACVRFAAECLAFAHVPEQKTLETHLPVPVLHHPDWKSRVPRDRGASWDFEDIRDHYLAELYAIDPARLRRENPERYLAFSRATTVEMAEATCAEWRRPQSVTSGALVWTLQDLLPGPGWGVIDSTGLEKPVWHGLHRAFRPRQVILSDEGTNGLYVHVLNESPEALDCLVHLACYRDGQTVVVQGQQELTLKPHSSLSLAATDLFGAFFDTTYAFRFGPPAHDISVATLRDIENGQELATAFHFPRGRAAALHPAVIDASIEGNGETCELALRANRFTQSVNLSFDGWHPSDNWFHLQPGSEKRVLLTKRGPDSPPAPSGYLGHLGLISITGI